MDLNAVVGSLQPPAGAAGAAALDADGTGVEESGLPTGALAGAAATAASGAAAQLANQVTVMGALLQGLQQAGETTQAAQDALVQSALPEESIASAPASALQTGQALVAANQVVARPASPSAGEAHVDTDARQAVDNQPSDAADPGVQAMPATLSSMQVEASWLWTAMVPGELQQGLQMIWPEDKRVRAGDERDRQAADATDDEADGDEEAAAEADVGAGDEATTDEDHDEPAVLEGTGTVDAAWPDALASELQRQLRAHEELPAPLAEAVQQWQRGRCVVLVCPQVEAAGVAAWAFVLWPRRRAAARSPRAAAQALPHALRGERFAAVLQWSDPADVRASGAARAAARWWQARTVKEHHPQRGRQLHSLPPGVGEVPDGPVDVELQLGPVLSRTPRWRVACVRVAAARRFWAALAAQWSVHLLVCDRPLIPETTPTLEVTEC